MAVVVEARETAVQVRRGPEEAPAHGKGRKLLVAGGHGPGNRLPPKRYLATRGPRRRPAHTASRAARRERSTTARSPDRLAPAPRPHLWREFDESPAFSNPR